MNVTDWTCPGQGATVSQLVALLPPRTAEKLSITITPDTTDRRTALAIRRDGPPTQYDITRIGIAVRDVC